MLSAGNSIVFIVSPLKAYAYTPADWQVDAEQQVIAEKVQI